MTSRSTLRLTVLDRASAQKARMISARRCSMVWTAPVILEALIPGRMQSHVSTAEVPRGAARARGQDGVGDPQAGREGPGRAPISRGNSTPGFRASRVHRFTP